MQCNGRKRSEKERIGIADSPCDRHTEGRTVLEEVVQKKLTYHWEGDFLIPDLVPPESPQIGIWGERRRQFLRTVQKPLYTDLLFSGKLNAHLEDVDDAADAMMVQLIAQFVQLENITEQFKVTDQMAWVQAMNSIRHREEEIVRRELIETISS